MNKIAFLKEYLSDQMAENGFNSEGQMKVNIFEIFSQKDVLQAAEALGCQIDNNNTPIGSFWIYSSQQKKS
ncbi:hypothetical protein [Eubacterium sp. 1001713B170207_170306_E7]|uniref:hypothetical protein n=1 Tax=Eubacterium sp. 1001713B170207_170306_E7 TaxID=2787097 RepID=UPI001898731E|nr:hypothetical protein [Eubacterium sp. 1001713B170207_170306_E7]